MKIEKINNIDLTQVILKLSNNSITVKQNNKTKAIINDVCNVNKLQFNKRVELNIKLEGMLNDILSINKNLYIDNNNNIYCFLDINYLDMLEKQKDNKYFYEEIQKMNNIFNLCNKYNIKIIKANIS